MSLVSLVGAIRDTNRMKVAADKNTELKKMAMKGSIWFSLLWTLIAIVPYHLYVVFFDASREMQVDMQGLIFPKEIRNFCFDFFQFFVCFMGIYWVRIFMRKSGTEFPVWKNQSFVGAVKNLFTSLKTFHTVIPLIVLIVIQIVICAPTNTLVAWYLVPLSLVFLFFDSLTEEYAFRGILAELMIIKRRETVEGVFFSICCSGILSGLYTIAVLVFVWSVPAHPIFLASVVAFNCMLSMFYYRTNNIFVPALCRFLMKTAILTPSIVFGAQAITASDEFYAVMFLICFILVLFSYVGKDEFNLMENIVKGQTRRVVDFYAMYGVESSNSSWNPYQSYLNKRDGRSNLSTKALTVKYVKNAVAFSMIIVIIYAALKDYFKFAQWQLLTDAGIEFISIQISATFLILSFLSFLTSRDDYILWLDTMSHKFIYPRYFNFVDTSVYAFTAMLFSLAAHLCGAEYLMFIFFIIGISILIRMTFKMINVFFNRNGLLVEIEQLYFDADLRDKKKYLSDLYQNSVHVIEQNDCKKIQENFAFLAKLYSVYKREYECFKNAFVIDEETGIKSVELSTIPRQNENMILKFYLRYDDEEGYGLARSPGFFQHDKERFSDNVSLCFEPDEEDMYQLLVRVEDEIICFVTMLLPINPVLTLQLLSGYNSRLLEIDRLREKIKEYILGEIDEKGDAFAVPIFFRDVLGDNIWALRSAELELTFLKEDEEDDDEYIPENSFTYNIRACYKNIRDKHPDKYDAICLNMLEEVNICYEKMNKLAIDLKPAEQSDNPAVCESYKEWLNIFSERYDKFKNIYKSKRQG